MLMYTNGAHGI